MPLVDSMKRSVELNANMDIVSVVVKQMLKCSLPSNGVPNGLTPANVMSPIMKYKRKFRLRLNGKVFLDEVNQVAWST